LMADQGKGMEVLFHAPRNPGSNTFELPRIADLVAELWRLPIGRGKVRRARKVWCVG